MFHLAAFPLQHTGWCSMVVTLHHTKMWNFDNGEKHKNITHLHIMQKKTWIEAPVISRISLIFEPPFPIRDPHWNRITTWNQIHHQLTCDAGTTRRKVMGGRGTVPGDIKLLKSWVICWLWWLWWFRWIWWWSSYIYEELFFFCMLFSHDLLFPLGVSKILNL